MPPYEIPREHIPQHGLSRGLMALITLDHKRGGPRALPNQFIAALSAQGQPALYDLVIVFAYQKRTTEGEDGLSALVVVEDLHMTNFRKIVEACQRHEHIERALEAALKEKALDEVRDTIAVPEEFRVVAKHLLGIHVSGLPKTQDEYAMNF